MDPSALKEGYRLLIIQARPREGAKRLGQGQSAVDLSSDRKWAKKKSFQGRMTGPSVSRSRAQESG